MAARVSDRYFTNGNTPEEIGKQVADLRTKAAASGHAVKVGVNAFAIARDTEAEAKAVLAEIIATTGHAGGRDSRVLTAGGLGRGRACHRARRHRPLLRRGRGSGRSRCHGADEGNPRGDRPQRGRQILPHQRHQRHLYRPDRGRVTLGDRSFAQVPTERLAALGVARTFQNLALFKGLGVFDNVATGHAGTARASFLAQVLGTGQAKREKAEAWERASAIFGFFDLLAFQDRSVATLPYGVQKRVELARALVGRPKLLLLDEPMAGMTTSEKHEMAGFVRAARDNFGTTVVLIEHDIGVVMGLSDRIAVLDYGRKIADGTPEEVAADQTVIEAYLGVAHDDQGGA